MSDENVVRSVPLPPGAEPPIQVYVNGEPWAEGSDWAQEDGRLRFLRTLRARPKLGFGRSVMLAIGIGVYGDLKGDQLDITYRVDGTTRSASVPLSPGDAPG